MNIFEITKKFDNLLQYQKQTAIIADRLLEMAEKLLNDVKERTNQCIH